ncbi:hypothetical protein CLOP_g3192 [Closterium sp. NIES-67]|nr:hypothetical protein CLOP_g3192 [Closterium sp. NIES-67]
MAAPHRSTPCSRLSRSLTRGDLYSADDDAQVDNSRPLTASSATRDPLEGGRCSEPGRHDDVSDSVSASRDVSRSFAATSRIPASVQPSLRLSASHNGSQEPSATASQSSERHLQSQVRAAEESRELQQLWGSLAADASDRAWDSVDNAEPSNAEAARTRREVRVRMDAEKADDGDDDLGSCRSDRSSASWSRRQSPRGRRSMRARGQLKWGEHLWRARSVPERMTRTFTLKDYIAQPMPAHALGAPSDPPTDREAAEARALDVQVQVFRRVLRVMRAVRIPVVHPYSQFRRDVNLLIALCITYNVWEVFFQVAFNLRAQGAWQIVDACLSAIFLTDVFLGFKTGYVTREKHMVMDDGMKVLRPQQIVMDQRKVVWHYLRTWFALDLLSSLPFDLLTSLASDSPAGFWLSAAFRLLKLFRVHRLGVAAKQLRHAATNTNYMDVAILMFQICMLCHIGACIFVLIGRLEEPPETWLAITYWSTDGASQTLETAPPGVVYVAAIYWSMVTFAGVGYGDIHPVDTVAERLFATVYILVTAVMLGYTIGELSSMVYAHRVNRDAMRQRMCTLHRFIEKEHLPEWLANRMMAYLMRQWQADVNSKFEELELMQSLSDDLRTDLFVHWWMHHVPSSPFFPHDQQCLACLQRVLVPRGVAAGDVIAREGEVSRHVYIVRAGSVEMAWAKEGVEGLVEGAAAQAGKPMLGEEGMRLARAVSMRRCASRALHRPTSRSSHASPMALPHCPMPSNGASPTPVHCTHGTDGGGYSHGRDGTAAGPRACDLEHGDRGDESPTSLCSPRVRCSRTFEPTLSAIESMDGSSVHWSGRERNRVVDGGTGGAAVLPGDGTELLREGAPEGSADATGGGPATGMVPRNHSTAEGDANAAGGGAMVPRNHSTAASHNSYGSSGVRHGGHVGGQAAFESRTVGVGHVVGLDGLTEVLELQTAEPSWPDQRVPFLFMEGTFQAKTECELLLLLIDDLFDTLESFPELLTALRLSLGLPLTEQEQLVRYRKALSVRRASNPSVQQSRHIHK